MTEADAPDGRFSGLPVRPGKIIAIHLSYESRAAQRGRRPASPSYFFKPSSSVAASGSTIERPAGTELLAFEGEIALVIGRAARRVSLTDAWAHVAWITAANDFGLYDLRANDKGSNVRSKGGDGFTPIGPSLIDARTVDPAAVRLRTWVNGEIVQDDTAAGLIFPLAQFVADLSQHFTLEPGDVILTGTPAGSSVVVPGGKSRYPTVTSISFGSRPSASQWRRSTSSLWATSSGPPKMLQESAYWATRRRVFRSPLPPIMIRGLGLLTGIGLQSVSSS
jgi:2-keto-4-pentenoate hydratase/2-oxohepta-3-ene-1,7-dioic acid hydratase in catechol pathway